MCYKKQMYDGLKMFSGLDTAEVELGKCYKKYIHNAILFNFSGLFVCLVVH